MIPDPFPHQDDHTAGSEFPVCRHCDVEVFASGAPEIVGWAHLQETECGAPCPVTWPCECDFWDDDGDEAPAGPFWPFVPHPAPVVQLVLFEAAGP
jgi:hypothetical protein